MELIGQFIELSKYAGMREDLVQASGGNTSVKLDDNCMLVKASGIQLANISQDSGYATVDQSIITDYFLGEKSGNKEDESALIERCFVSGGRPSIETFLHAITGRFTLHAHPVCVNMLCCRTEGYDTLKKMFPDAVFVDYATPGIDLAKKYYTAVKQQQGTQMSTIFLKNHGIVISGESSHEVIDRMEHITNCIEKSLSLDFDRYHHATYIYRLLRKLNDDSLGLVYCSNDANIREAAKSGMWRYDFCPDCLVYCGRNPLILNQLEFEEVYHYYRDFGMPSVIWYRNNCFICSSNLNKAKEIESVLGFSAVVSAFNGQGKIDFLPQQECDFLLNWDAEKYRKNINSN